MKKFGVLVLVGAMVIASGLASCATASSIGGTADAHGLLSEAPVVADGASEIASYTVILGLLDSGYKDYAAKVREAEAAGKKITTVTKWYYVLITTTAYAK